MKNTNQIATENNIRNTAVSVCEGACACCKCSAEQCTCGTNCKCCSCETCQCG